MNKTNRATALIGTTPLLRRQMSPDVMTVGGAGQGNLATLPAEDSRRRRASTGRPFRIFGPSLDLASGFTLPPRDGESPWMQISPAPASSEMRAPMCTAMPWTSPCDSSISPVCIPARISKPIDPIASTAARAHSMARRTDNNACDHNDPPTRSARARAVSSTEPGNRLVA